MIIDLFILLIINLWLLIIDLFILLIINFWLLILILIIKDLMEDPVTTETGMTYEREVIREHFEKNGKIDPVTRKPISD